MGGGGSVQTVPVGGQSGQGGGRILPGTAGGVGELYTVAARSVPGVVINGGYPDLRPNAPLGWNLDTAWCQPGGGPGAMGKSSDFPIFGWDGGNGLVLESGMGGGGGGWGAAGGAAAALVFDSASGFETRVNNANPGGAGGKAINTNGHAVTWLGGANRAYGAVG